MFKVQNADFIADKLAEELLPDQEIREVLTNALEAVQRRMNVEGVEDGGRVEFDVDWNVLEKTGHWYISCTDNGDGMTRGELERYMTTLAVQGAGRNQSLRGNQGMGLKIAGPTKHKKGVLIRSLKPGERTTVQIGWDGVEYGLIPIGPNDELVMTAPLAAFPEFVQRQASGTVVTFLGNEDDDNTVVPERHAKGWLLKYLNTRFFRLSADGIKVYARVPSGEVDEWPQIREEANRSKSFNLTMARGTKHMWDAAADFVGEGFRGSVALAGDATQGIPTAEIHWWVLPPPDAPKEISARHHGGSSFAVLYQNELHDWKTGYFASPYFARLGVLWGKSRIAFILEPKGPTVSSDFARAHVLVNGARVLDSDCWAVWSEQFKQQMPERIKLTMKEEEQRLQVEDPDRIRRIRDRLKEVMQLLRPRRFRPLQQGRVKAAGPQVAGPGKDGAEVIEFPREGRPSVTKRPRSRGIGAVLSEMEDQNGTPATETVSAPNLQPRWVTEDEAETFTMVKANGNGLRDRAAALAGTDGRSATILLLNREFRGYQAIVAAMNEWANPEGDDDKLRKIESITQEWVEQKMIEAVEGLWQLENGKTWITEHYDEAMSPVALTAAFMADRYHLLREVKRQVGAFRQPGTAAKAE
jgi:hypothetical protein